MSSLGRPKEQVDAIYRPVPAAVVVWHPPALGNHPALDHLAEIIAAQSVPERQLRRQLTVSVDAHDGPLIVFQPAPRAALVAALAQGVAPQKAVVDWSTALNGALEMVAKSSYPAYLVTAGTILSNSDILLDYLSPETDPHPSASNGSKTVAASGSENSVRAQAGPGPDDVVLNLLAQSLLRDAPQLGELLDELVENCIDLTNCAWIEAPLDLTALHMRHLDAGAAISSLFAETSEMLQEGSTTPQATLLAQLHSVQRDAEQYYAAAQELRGKVSILQADVTLAAQERVLMITQIQQMDEGMQADQAELRALRRSDQTRRMAMQRKDKKIGALAGKKKEIEGRLKIHQSAKTDLVAQLADLHDAHADLLKRYRDLKASEKAARRQTKKLQTRVAGHGYLTDRIAALEVEMSHSRGALAGHQATLEAIRASRAYRMTRPLRWVRAAFANKSKPGRG